MKTEVRLLNVIIGTRVLAGCKECRDLGWVLDTVDVHGGPVPMILVRCRPVSIEIEYAAHAALELNRHKVASDPMVRTFLQGWRAILAGSADMDVYEDVTK